MLCNEDFLSNDHDRDHDDHNDNNNDDNNDKDENDQKNMTIYIFFYWRGMVRFLRFDKMYFFVLYYDFLLLDCSGLFGIGDIFRTLRDIEGSPIFRISPLE